MGKVNRALKRRTRGRTTVLLSVKLPPKRIREKFLVTYELEGCQTATDYLTQYYGVKRLQLFLNGRKVGSKRTNRWIACYNLNKAYFTKAGLRKRLVLHEFYHHLVYSNKIDIPLRIEEQEANAYARQFLNLK